MVDSEAQPRANLPGPLDPFQVGPRIRVRTWKALWKSIWPSFRFLFQTEVHVYSFAIAANTLLSFFPFLVVMIILCKNVLHWQAAVNVIIQLVHDYFPEDFGVNFKGYLLSAAARHNFSWLSIFLLFFTANGIFEPLEVAFNRIWRVKRNRSYVRNQAISLGMIFVCGILVLISVAITTLNTQYLNVKIGASHHSALMRLVVFKASAVPVTMLMIFLIYWLLPNAKIPAKRLIAASIFVGILLEILKYVNLLTWPWLHAKLAKEVPPFVQSISIILWSFASAIVILAGAEWAARVRVEALEPSPDHS